MKLNGSFEVPGTPEQVYEFLTTPEDVVAALPDIESAELRTDGFKIDARVGVGPMRGTMKLDLAIVEREPNVRAVYAGQGKGLGSVVDMTAGFTLRDAASGTAVDWAGEAKIVGRLASVAGGMLEPLAKKKS